MMLPIQTQVTTAAAGVAGSSASPETAAQGPAGFSELLAFLGKSAAPADRKDADRRADAAKKGHHGPRSGQDAVSGQREANGRPRAGSKSEKKSSPLPASDAVAVAVANPLDLQDPQAQATLAAALGQGGVSQPILDVASLGHRGVPRPALDASAAVPAGSENPSVTVTGTPAAGLVGAAAPMDEEAVLVNALLGGGSEVVTQAAGAGPVAPRDTKERGAGEAGSAPASTVGVSRPRAAGGDAAAQISLASSVRQGGGEPVSLDTLWLFRGDPTYAAAMADAPARPQGAPEVGVAVDGFKPGQTLGTISADDSGLRPADGLVATEPGASTVPQGTAQPAVIVQPATAPAVVTVDASVQGSLPGAVGREIGRWMQGRARPLPDGGAELELRLQPASLGAIHIRLHEKNGELSAQILVADASVGQQMARAMPRLAEDLARHGLALGSVSVGTSGAGQDSGNGTAQGSYSDPSAYGGQGSSRSASVEPGSDAPPWESAEAPPASVLGGGRIVNVHA